MPGIFTISLDFELHWGVFDKRDRMQRQACYRNTRQLIPQLIHLFDEYGISATWATVGSLFVNDEEEWRAYIPQLVPQYQQQKFSAYNFADANGIGEDYNWAHFAPDLVQQIAQSSSQELATHTFSHYYCLEAGQDVDAFKADLEKVQLLANQKTGNNLTSLVFPRNQFNQQYLEACYEAGISVIRSNPNAWYWSGVKNDDTSLTRKLFRTGDVFLPLGNKCFKLDSIKHARGLPISLPASRLLRQYDPKKKYLNKLRLRRIINELKHAALNNEVYHLWWHPENFGNHPHECMEELELILQEFDKLRNKFGMQSWPMKRYAEELIT